MNNLLPMHPDNDKLNDKMILHGTDIIDSTDMHKVTNDKRILQSDCFICSLAHLYTLPELSLLCGNNYNTAFLGYFAVSESLSYLTCNGISCCSNSMTDCCAGNGASSINCGICEPQVYSLFSTEMVANTCGGNDKINTALIYDYLLADVTCTTGCCATSINDCCIAPITGTSPPTNIGPNVIPFVNTPAPATAPATTTSSTSRGKGAKGAGIGVPVALVFLIVGAVTYLRRKKHFCFKGNNPSNDINATASTSQPSSHVAAAGAQQQPAAYVVDPTGKIYTSNNVNTAIRTADEVNDAVENMIKVAQLSPSIADMTENSDSTTSATHQVIVENNIDIENVITIEEMPETTENMVDENTGGESEAMVQQMANGVGAVWNSFLPSTTTTTEQTSS
jgi:hypothetical protein